MVRMSSGEMERRIVETHEAVKRVEDELHSISTSLVSYQQKTDALEKEVDGLKKFWVPISIIFAAIVAFVIGVKIPF